jgi:hypothetical protein
MHTQSERKSMRTSTKKAQPKVPSKRTKAAKTTHTFELVYNGSFDSYDDIESVIILGGREDIFLGWQNGAYRLGFSKKAPSFRTALLSAIADVECLGLDLELVDVEVE